MWTDLSLDGRSAWLRQHCGECILLDHTVRGVIYLLLMGIEQKHDTWWLTGFEDAEANGLCCLRLDRIRDCLVEEEVTPSLP